MGYYITVRDVHFKIKKHNFEKALEAIKELPPHGWVDSRYTEADTLEEAMTCWRWEAGYNAEGDIDYLLFIGEKLGNDEMFFTALAPYVEPDSYIEMDGEENALWRWCFDGQGMEEQFAEIRWV